MGSRLPPGLSPVAPVDEWARRANAGGPLAVFFPPRLLPPLFFFFLPFLLEDGNGKT